MTDLDAIRAHVASGGNIGPVDAASLLAEVDRLRWQLEHHACPPPVSAVQGGLTERARIRAVVEVLHRPGRSDINYRAVLAAIDGETT